MFPRRRLIILAVSGLFASLAAPSEGVAGPAPPLTQLQAEFASPQFKYGQYWDVVPVGGISTPGDHGGSYLLIGVLETGYSSWSIATFNGQQLNLIQSVPQVNYLGQVWGYIHYYEYVGNFTSGSFTYQAQSLVAPYRMLSMRIFVR